MQQRKFPKSLILFPANPPWVTDLSIISISQCGPICGYLNLEAETKGSKEDLSTTLKKEPGLWKNLKSKQNKQILGFLSKIDF